MKTLVGILAFLVLAGFCGCSDRREAALLGTWRTDVIPSEWGSNRITMTYLPRGRIVSTNDFGDGAVLGWDGTYSVDGSVMHRTIRGRTEEIAYSIDGNTMYQRVGSENYTLRRVTEPSGLSQ